MSLKVYFNRGLVAVLATACGTSALAQDLRAQFLPPIDLKPVAFESDVKDSIGSFTNIANSTFKPAGSGRFPAVVLMHTCGGVKNAHIKQHAQELLKTGYVVLVVDSFNPRGMENCATRISVDQLESRMHTLPLLPSLRGPS